VTRKGVGLVSAAISPRSTRWGAATASRSAYPARPPASPGLVRRDRNVAWLQRTWGSASSCVIRLVPRVALPMSGAPRITSGMASKAWSRASVSSREAYSKGTRAVTSRARRDWSAPRLFRPTRSSASSVGRCVTSPATAARQGPAPPPHLTSMRGSVFQTASRSSRERARGAGPESGALLLLSEVPLPALTKGPSLSGRLVLAPVIVCPEGTANAALAATRSVSQKLAVKLLAIPRSPMVSRARALGVKSVCQRRWLARSCRSALVGSPATSPARRVARAERPASQRRSVEPVQMLASMSRRQIRRPRAAAWSSIPSNPVVPSMSASPTRRMDCSSALRSADRAPGRSVRRITRIVRTRPMSAPKSIRAQPTARVSNSRST